mmetsp:Transcript_18478/g.45781  ORF Transcript_18478/g.45781 Transcript_18478/m.45781 type:complete len:246 (-) Transcript_18478:885-1622(-)
MMLAVILRFQVHRVFKGAIRGNARAGNSPARLQQLGIACLTVEIGIHCFFDHRMVNPSISGMQLNCSVENGFLSSFQDLLSFVFATLCLTTRQGHSRAPTHEITSFLTVKYFWKSCAMNGGDQLYTSLSDSFRCTNFILGRDFINYDAVGSLIFDRFAHYLCLMVGPTDWHPPCSPNRRVRLQTISGNFARLIYDDSIKIFILGQNACNFSQSSSFPNPRLADNQEGFMIVGKIVKELRPSSHSF